MIFPADTVLENEGVRLRALRVEDEAALARIAFDPEIWTYFVVRIDSAMALGDFVADAVRAIRTGERFCFVVIDQRSHQLAGSMSFGNDSPRDRRIEIGWSWLGQAYRGTDVNKWAKLAMLEHAFERMQYQRVEFKTDVLNQRARRALVKLGAVEEGVLRSHTQMPGGRRRDTIFYSILADEWPRVKAEVFGR